ncbi:hypothetical protein [Denitrobaculum tricleocarpae]|uniref:HTH cro/C1-type domain-containing protein n=1 Tax=Denitrobaculum tricleocarpae TaxID=2591009 RepID=A0A545TSZ9_9PROT|nr:hypothetical protein [Denitrobaculum tricleocarpae]TQV80343.1 hypothetical protein FKG95_09110 [Denitrobaculum tricleocarpae]
MARIDELNAQGEDATERNVSLRAGTGPDQIRKMKTKGQRPAAGKLEAIAKVLGVNYTWLSTGIGEKEINQRTDANGRESTTALVKSSIVFVLDELGPKKFDLPNDFLASMITTVMGRLQSEPKPTLTDLSKEIASMANVYSEYAAAPAKDLKQRLEQDPDWQAGGRFDKEN